LGEVVAAAAHILNRTPSKAISLQTPYEKWTGHKPSLAHLRVFGCLAYARVKQGKLEHRAKKCLFISYPSGVKGYKLWNLESDGPRTIVSRDVTFDEDSTIKLGIHEPQPNQEESGESVQVEIPNTS